MKTSIDIAESLFKRAKQLSRRRSTSVRALVEEGLRLVFEREEKREAVEPKLVTFGGDGLTEEFRARGLSWDALRDEIYRGHGA